MAKRDSEQDASPFPVVDLHPALLTDYQNVRSTKSQWELSRIVFLQEKDDKLPDTIIAVADPLAVSAFGILRGRLAMPHSSYYKGLLTAAYSNPIPGGDTALIKNRIALAQWLAIVDSMIHREHKFAYRLHIQDGDRLLSAAGAVHTWLLRNRTRGRDRIDHDDELYLFRDLIEMKDKCTPDNIRGHRAEAQRLDLDADGHQLGAAIGGLLNDHLNREIAKLNRARHKLRLPTRAGRPETNVYEFKKA